MCLLIDRRTRFYSLLRLVFLVFCSSFALVSWSENNRGPTLMLLAYNGEAWNPYLLTVDRRGPQSVAVWEKVDAIEDPLQVTWDSAAGKLYYRAIDGEVGSLHLASGKTESVEGFGPGVLAELTQLSAVSDDLIGVRLRDGKSRKTDLVKIHPDGKLSVLFKQDSAKFQPLRRDGKIYYGNVSCRAACATIIQDVWAYDLATQKVKQLTMLNATTSMHSLDEKEQVGYISSNQRGYYNIASFAVGSGGVVWLTSGAVTDSFPSLVPSGDLYFLRDDMSGSRLMTVPKADLVKSRRGDVVTPVDIALPKNIKKIRYLEGNG